MAIDNLLGKKEEIKAILERVELDKTEPQEPEVTEIKTESDMLKELCNRYIKGVGDHFNCSISEADEKFMGTIEDYMGIPDEQRDYVRKAFFDYMVIQEQLGRDFEYSTINQLHKALKIYLTKNKK